MASVRENSAGGQRGCEMTGTKQAISSAIACMRALPMRPAGVSIRRAAEATGGTGLRSAATQA